MTSYDFGEVVLVRFPFTDLAGSKKRPAVVVSSASYPRAWPDVVLMPITSQFSAAPEAGDMVLQHWQAAHLLKPSAIKPIFTTVEVSLIERMLGRLDDADQQRLHASLRKMIG